MQDDEQPPSNFEFDAMSGTSPFMQSQYNNIISASFPLSLPYQTSTYQTTIPAEPIGIGSLPNTKNLNTWSNASLPQIFSGPLTPASFPSMHNLNFARLSVETEE